MGWLGGFLPSIAFAITAYTGDIYSGLRYPLIVTAVCLVVVPCSCVKPGVVAERTRQVANANLGSAGASRSTALALLDRD